MSEVLNDIKFTECKTEYQVPTQARLSKLISRLQNILEAEGDVLLNNLSFYGVSWELQDGLNTTIPFKDLI